MSNSFVLQKQIICSLYRTSKYFGIDIFRIQTINHNNKAAIENNVFGYNGKEHKTIKIIGDITSLYPQLKGGRQTTHDLNVES